MRGGGLKGENSGGEEQQGRCEEGGKKGRAVEYFFFFSVNRNRPLGFRNCVV